MDNFAARPAKPIALLAAHDTSGLIELGAKLIHYGFNLVASETTAQFLRSANLSVRSVSVRALVDSSLGLLAHDPLLELDYLSNELLETFSVVVCNLGPPNRNQQKDAPITYEIGIGGLSLIRRAIGRSPNGPLVLTSPKDYPILVQFLEQMVDVAPEVKRTLVANARDYIDAYEAQVDGIFLEISQTCDLGEVLSRFAAEQDSSNLAEDHPHLKTPVFLKHSATKKAQPLPLDAQARLKSAEGQNLKRLGFDVERILGHLLEQEGATKQEAYDSEVVRFDFTKPITALELRGKRKLCPEAEPPRPSRRATIYNKLLSATGPFYPFDEQNRMVEASAEEVLDVAGEFAATSDSLVSLESATRDVWHLLEFLITKLYVLEVPEADQVVPRGHFKLMYAAQHLDYFGSKARGFRVLLKAASLAFLNEGYRKYVDAVAGDCHDDLCAKIDDFIRKVHANYAGDFWARAYHLLRCGYSDELLRHVAENRRRMLKRDSFLLDRLEALLADPNGRITEDEQQAILKEIRHLGRVSTEDPNPFHLALLKLVGGVDPKSEAMPEVCATYEDALWFQLYAVREPIKEKETPTEEATEASTSTLDISDDAYDPDRDLELLSGHNSLSNQSADTWSLESLQKLVMAVGGQLPVADEHLRGLHLAIVLEHYGLLRTVKKPKFSLLVYSFRLEESRVVGEIQFDALLVSALANVAPSDASLALPYIELLNGFSSPAYQEMCTLLIERLVLDTRQYEVLLGFITPAGQFEVGLIEKSKHLLPTSDFDHFFHQLCRRAALSELMANDLYAAEGVFTLIRDYGACLQIINKQLTDVLFPISLALSSEFKDELVLAARAQTDRLRDRLLRHLALTESSETCPIQIATAIILEMLDFCLFRLQENDSEGRILLHDLYIIPASSSPEDLAEKLAQLTGLNTWVKRCIPSVFALALQFIKRSVGFPFFISTEPEDLDLVRRARSISLLVAEDMKHQLIPESAIAPIQSETFFV
ncbi:nuclear pore complex subunit, partial [Massospora cicadina]